MNPHFLHLSSGMCLHIKTRHPIFSETFLLPSLHKDQLKSSSHTPNSVYDAWLASRVIPRRSGTYLVPGTQRPFNRTNARLAGIIARECASDLFRQLWGLHPLRTALMMSLNVVRSLSPAFRGYWQALALNELQSLITSNKFTWSYLARLMLTEIFRRILESSIDSFAVANENVVHSSARFFVEHQQLEQRVKLDLPTLADPTVRDLLQESELFARSFNGMGGFGLLSPFDFIHILALVTEVASHIWAVLSLTGGSIHVGILLLSVLSVMLPLMLSWTGFSPTHSDALYNSHEARAAERQEMMRNLAHSDTHRPEIILFGLGPWILRSWASAREVMMGSEQPPSLKDSALSISLLSHINFSDLFFALQNIPLVLMLQSSSGSLGSLTLYRSSVQSVVFAVGNLITTTRMAFQGIFLMGAFCAAMRVQPRLHPKKEDTVNYRGLQQGAKIELRNLCYTYPGSQQPSLKNINLTLEAGETLALVGYNGSGKSTLAKILLRILDFDSGELLVNGVDIRRYNPVDYHHHVTAVFQSFSKFSSTVQENVGVGYVDHLKSRAAVKNAIQLAGAKPIIDSLPHGLRTKLDTAGFDIPFPETSINEIPQYMHHGLSGGEWQRIAISRAFMRADRPEIDLLLFDEPTSSLDAHAQNSIFDTIEKISRSPSGERIKTVIFITHRLSTARRADKVAMMENGTISEFGTHEELLRRGGSYSALYGASV